MPKGNNRLQPGVIRDAIMATFKEQKEIKAFDLHLAVEKRLGHPVAASSVRSYLNLNVGTVFKRVGPGRYRLQ